jgi:hypothetical protein
VQAGLAAVVAHASRSQWLERLRQEDHKFKANPGNLAKLNFNKGRRM